jgi:hypothetical protein
MQRRTVLNWWNEQYKIHNFLSHVLTRGRSSTRCVGKTQKHAKPMQENPYAAPTSNLSGSDSFSQAVGVTPGIIEKLRRTRGWVRFVAVLTIIGAIFMLIAAVGGVAVSKFASEKMTSQMGGENQSLFMPVSNTLSVIIVIYGLFGLLSLIAGIKLNRFASSITRLEVSRQITELEDTLNRQRSYWTFIGGIVVLF